MASSASPAEDNHKNKLHDTMNKALDTIMVNTEQSYEEFVDTFTYLKKGNVLPQKKLLPTTDLLGKKGTPVAHTEINRELAVTTDMGKTVQSNQDCLSQEDLETEVLADGEVSSRLSQSKTLRTGAVVKVDNFVDVEADEGGELLEGVTTAGYRASFTDGSHLAGHRTSHSQRQSRDRSADEETDMLFGQLSLNENSTDKLLLNFLADLQNEANEQAPISNPEQNDSSMDIEQFLNKNHENKEEVTFSDDDSDVASALLDTSDNVNVKVVVKHEELVDIESKKPTQSVALEEDISVDSEGVRTVNEPKENSTVEAEEEPKVMLFPGEVETTDDQPGSRHDSLLDFKAIYREPTTDRTEGANQEQCSDMVECFCLDAEFDYDNVVLAPKFSQADIQKLQSAISLPS